MTEHSYIAWVYGLSSILILAVAFLYFGPKVEIHGSHTDNLPTFNAWINASVSTLLVIGYILIRQGKVKAHRTVMTSAIVLSIGFLASYVTYHATHESTSFGGEGWIRPVYYFVLISHIIMATAIVPLVLITYVRALSARFDKHRKIARVTLPLWLYVSITGVIVYLMISPYYQ